MDEPVPCTWLPSFPATHSALSCVLAKPFALCSCPATLVAPGPSITPSPLSSVFPGPACSSVSHSNVGHHSSTSPGPPTHLKPPAATSVPLHASHDSHFLAILPIWRDAGVTLPRSAPRDTGVPGQHSISVISSLVQLWRVTPQVWAGPGVLHF